MGATKEARAISLNPWNSATLDARSCEVTGPRAPRRSVAQREKPFAIRRIRSGVALARPSPHLRRVTASLAAMVVGLLTVAGSAVPRLLDPPLGNVGDEAAADGFAGGQGSQTAPHVMSAPANGPHIDRRAAAGVVPNASACTVSNPASDLSASSVCLECHRRLGNAGSHPVNIDYQAAQLRTDGSLRPVTAVVAKGVFLPGGVVHCTTCHDARSPWANHIALPPGSVALPAVDPRKPETYENAPNWRVAQITGAAPLPPGTSVGAAPLCAVCHTVAD
jgi:hypothetical protein